MSQRDNRGGGRDSGSGRVTRDGGGSRNESGGGSSGRTGNRGGDNRPALTATDAELKACNSWFFSGAAKVKVKPTFDRVGQDQIEKGTLVLRAIKAGAKTGNLYTQEFYITVWGEKHLDALDHVKEGDWVKVEGCLHQNSWQSNGEWHSRLELVIQDDADSIKVIDDPNGASK